MAAKSDVYKAKESFVTQFKGEQVSVRKGDLARKGHPILRGRKDLFVLSTDYIRFDTDKDD